MMTPTGSLLAEMSSSNNTVVCERVVLKGRVMFRKLRKEREIIDGRLRCFQAAFHSALLKNSREMIDGGAVRSDV